MKSRGEAEGPLGVRLTRRQLLQAGAVVGLGAGLASSGLLAACGSSGSGTGAAPTASSRAIKRGGVFTFATDQLFPKDGLDPLKNIDDGQDALEGMLREGLVSYDFKFQPVPRLAQTWDVNPELTEYTFHLRPNVTWHDGTPFTAKDAAWSIERIMSPEGGSGMMQRLDSSIDKNGVVVVDDLTLKLKLKRPDSLLLLALSNQQCYLVKANSKEADYAKGIGTGPFKLKFYNEGQSFEVDKNPAYWMTGYPIVDTVRGIQDPEESTKLQSVASGAASVTQVSFDQLAVVKANSKLQVNPYEKGITYCVVCDCTTKPFSDPRVRQALKLSIDRDNVINIAYGGQGFASPDAWVAMDDPFMNDTLIATTKMDRAKATQLMTEAGYASGIDLNLKAPGDALHANFSLAFAAATKGSPFRITVKQIPADTYWDTVWMKDPFCVDDWNRRHPVETMALNCQSSAPWNESKWKSAKMDALLTKAYASTGDALTAATTECCEWMASGDGGSGEMIPAYLNRLWTSRVGTRVVPWTFSMLDFRQCGFYA